MIGRMTWRLAIVVVGMCLIGTTVRGLTVDEVALIVNSAEPESLGLAKFYATARGLPESHIIQVSLPTTDDLPGDAYDPGVVEPVRLALVQRNLHRKVRCLVTVYGVPLKVRAMTAPDKPERDTTAALDSELSLLWKTYDRAGWLENSLHLGGPAPDPRQLMVMRLDGPTPQSVRDMIAASVTVERDGLRGRVVIDGGGGRMLDPDGKKSGYRPYDETFAQLAALARTRSTLDVLYDDAPAVLPAGSAREVALYCGWYSVRKYVPACAFAPGAVGYHVASYELFNLHNPAEQGWARGLLADGAAATLGPVSEPFLHAFPRVDHFFPLLMTGKLTLAEVYWRTTPTVSWMVSMIGDPLYNPFKSNPALAVDDLLADLRTAVDRGAMGADRE